jgi:anaerobic dimethyl sulfoxide reductase subunit B
MKQLAFYFDASQCSGCKTCQVACKDKHDHPVGMRWRNVYEVAGGNWQAKGHNWISGIRSYNISMACNHCKEPICMTKCPNKAIYKNELGLVLIDEKRCMGCQYCAWACPYGALHLDKTKGKMTKCTMCDDYIAEGKLPSCVTACPMRVLEAGDLDELRKKHGSNAESYPLPPPHFTKPALVIKKHPAAKAQVNWKIINREEVKNA